MNDNAELECWWKARSLQVQGRTVPNGKIFACAVDRDGTVCQNTIFHATVSKHGALDPVSIMLMRLAEKVGTANFKAYSFRFCVNPTFVLSDEAKGLIAYFETACFDYEKVHFTRLDFATLTVATTTTPQSFRVPAASAVTFKRVSRLTLQPAQMVDVPWPRFQIPPLKESFDLTAESDQNRKVHRLYMAAAFALERSRKAHIDPGGYNIAALLVSKEGQILSYGWNITTRGYFLHAELVAIFQYFRQTGEVLLPQGCRIYTTLKPCKMCAAYIVGRSPKRPAGFKVFHGHDDRGGPARMTDLDRLNSSQTMNSSQTVSVRIGENRTKPLRSYNAVEYDIHHRGANVARANVAVHLSSSIQYDHKTGQGIVSQLRTQAPKEFPKITNSLLRKAQKYSTTGVHNHNVKKALIHVLEFLQVSGAVEQGTVLQLVDPLADFSEEEWNKLYKLMDTVSAPNRDDDFSDWTEEDWSTWDASLAEHKRPFDPGAPAVDSKVLFGSDGDTPAGTDGTDTDPPAKRAKRE
jgi:tRNA(Arg) A34 adenosine deaminase TadA